MSTRPVIIAPSILSADFAKLGEEARAIQTAGADWLHVDVMDGHFVPNLTIGPMVVKAVRPHVSIPIDVHLMISPADPYIEAFRDAGADHLLVHPEAGPHLDRTVKRIRELGAKAGVVFNPSTPPDVIEYMMDDIDIILVMTVNPGFGGQSFIASQLPKIRKLRSMIDASGSDIVLLVDGGVTPDTAPLCVEAGATALVAGSAVFKDGPNGYARNIAALRG
jgi:ribulose-phosphate 3-epimerase